MTPSRLETDRRIESALSLFVVGVVLGALGELVTGSGQSIFMWLIRSRGYGASQASITSLAWSWASALSLAGRFAILIGLWRLARSLAGGRARGLAAAALWVSVASLVVWMSQQLLWSLARDWGSDSYRQTVVAFSLTGLGIYLLATGLWIASVVGLARTTPEGARRSWAGPILVAVAATLAQVAWTFYGSARALEWPGVGIAGNFVVTGIHAAGVLALLVPVRSVFRDALGRPDAHDAGPYRSPNLPEAAWRTAAELRHAGEGIAEVRRRVGQLGILMLLSLPPFLILSGAPAPPWSGYVGIVLGAIQLAFAVPLVRGLAGYTRAPYELLGRSLGIGALACLSSGVVLSARSLANLFAGLRGWEPAISSTAADSLGAAAMWLIGTALLIGSLSRAARGLGDEEVRRRAFVAVGTYFGCIGLAVVAVLVVFASVGTGVADGPRFFVIVSFGLALVCLAVYRWLLDGAAKMLTGDAGPA